MFTVTMTISEAEVNLSHILANRMACMFRSFIYRSFLRIMFHKYPNIKSIFVKD